SGSGFTRTTRTILDSAIHHSSSLAVDQAGRQPARPTRRRPSLRALRPIGARRGGARTRAVAAAEAPPARGTAGAKAEGAWRRQIWRAWTQDPALRGRDGGNRR